MPPTHEGDERNPVSDYLRSPDDSRASRLFAVNSHFSQPKVHAHHASMSHSITTSGAIRASNSGTRRGGSSTQPSESLPALSRDRTSRSSSGSMETPQTPGAGQNWIPITYLLDDDPDNGVLTVPGPLQCPFHFLRCFSRSLTIRNLFQHSLIHFRDKSPPLGVQCFFCNTNFQNSNGRDCWWQLIEHVVTHLEQGQSLANARPNAPLIRYLFCNKLIGDQDYKALIDECNGRNSTLSNNIYTTSNSSNGRRHQR